MTWNEYTNTAEYWVNDVVYVVDENGNEIEGYINGDDEVIGSRVVESGVIEVTIRQ